MKHIFQINWKAASWGKRIGFGFAFFFIGLATLALGMMLLRHTTDVTGVHDTLVFYFLGFGLLVMLNSRFWGLGFSLFLLGITFSSLGAKDNSGAALSLLVLLGYWVYRPIKWAVNRMKTPEGS